MERIVFLDRETFKAQFKKPDFAHEWREFANTKADEIIERLREATIAITNKVPLQRETLENLPCLRFVAVAATGFDKIDLECCRERRIAVANVPDYARHSVPEHVMMLVLALRRNTISYREALRDGAWQRSSSFCLLDYPIHDLHKSTFGIVGHGTLGRAVEVLARAFGMRVLISEHKGAKKVRPGRVSFDQLLSESDVITLHCPLTHETRNLIGAPELEKMRPHAVLINCARGGVVDERALIEALVSGSIGGAGVDVLTVEPPSAGNPLLETSLPNLIVTPHVAWASDEAMQTLADETVKNIEAFVAGEPRNLVT